MKISRGGKTGFEIFLPLFSFAIWSSGCGSIYECVKRKLKQGGALKRHIIGWQTLFSLFVIFPFIFLVLSNFGHVMKMVFFPFSARIFFPVPHFKMFPFHSGIVVCFFFLPFEWRGQGVKFENKQGFTIRDAQGWWLEKILPVS